jgi:hypothetical protein
MIKNEIVSPRYIVFIFVVFFSRLEPKTLSAHFALGGPFVLLSGYMTIAGLAFLTPNDAVGEWQQ